jgi:flagellar protein FliO/FliZ
MRRLLLLLAVLSLLAPRLAATSDVLFPRGSAGASPAVSSSGMGAPTMLLAAACAVAGAWFLWRSRRQSAGRVSKGKLSVAETRSLGNRQYLVVAAYGEKKFLIGVCVGQMNLLAALDDGAKSTHT